MNDFVEECRQEWRRLGVPDPIANEMASDLAADIEEAESEGGSAEDVLGNSAFDSRGFAASWADARGVTAAPTSDRPTRRRPVLAIALAIATLLLVMAGAVLLVGRHSASAALSVRRILGHGSIHVIPSQPYAPRIRISVGPPALVQHFEAFGVLVLVLLLVGAATLILALLYWSPWSRSDSKQRFR